MAGRYREEFETPARRAHRYNVWLRYYGVWYTPEEFIKKYGDTSSVAAPMLKLLNPLHELRMGRTMIVQMIMDGKNGPTIIDALERLYRFEDKLRDNHYEEISNQQNYVPWPTEQQYVAIGERNILREDPTGDVVMNNPDFDL